MAIRYDELITGLKRRLPSHRLAVVARDISFIRRLRCIRPGKFVWAVVLSRFGHGRPGFAEARQWYERLGGARLWPRPFQMRFKQTTVVPLFEKAFETAVVGWRSGRRVPHALSKWFADVVLWDSTLIQLPDALQRPFKGLRSAAASLKVTLAISAFGRVPLFARMGAGTDNDHRLFPPLEQFRPRTLWVFDAGFVAYRRFQEIDGAAQKFLCPMRSNGNAIILALHRGPAAARRGVNRAPGRVRLRDVLPVGKRINAVWDLDVTLFTRWKHRVHARLVIVPGPGGVQHPYLTNLDRTPWSGELIRELYRLRWQVELVFKELKQDLNLTAIPTKDPNAAQVFAWASLIALGISREVGAWLVPGPVIAGLAARLRPALITRALRATVRILAHILTAPAAVVQPLVGLFREELLREAASSETKRDDSFARLATLLHASAAA
jgi:Transposase DDE domain